MKTKILSIFTFAFIFSVGAQSLKGNKYYLKNLETVHEITFNEYYKKEKKIFANWGKNEDLTKVIITEQYDSSKLFNLLEKISMNENITDLFISFGNISFLKLPELPFIKVLKIYNSKNLNSNFFNENKLLFNEIKSFSWVNNAKTIDLNLLDNLQKLNSLELIDTGVNVINDDVLTGLYKIKDIQNFAFSYKNMPTINLNNFAFLNSFTPLNFEKTPFQLSVFNLLNTEDLNTHSVNVGNKILVKYFNQKNIFTENELASIINNVGLGKYPIKANYFDEISSRSNTIFKQEELETINELPEISGSDYAKNIAYFKKPIEAIQLEEKLIQFKQDKDTLIQLKNGTQIGIPKNCFINAKGEQVTDNIKIIYKEYSNPLSIFASGIPMSTMVNGEAKTLTSAGMFEIRAYSNDKELQIKEGKTIDINFASIDDGKKYNFYEFDKQKNTWVDKNIDLPKDTLPAKIVKSNTQSILNTYQIYNTNKVNFKDTTHFNGIFNDFSYYYLNNEKQN